MIGERGLFAGIVVTVAVHILLFGSEIVVVVVY